MTARLNPDGLGAVFVAATVALLGLMPILILPLFVGALVDYQGISTEAAGAVVSVNLLGNALGVLLFSLVLYRLPLKQFVYLGAALEIAADLAAILLDAPLSMLLLIRLAAGCGGGLVTGAAFNWMARRVDPDRGFGLLFAYQFLVSALLLFALPAVIPDLGVNTFYLLFVVAALVSVACAFVLSLGEPGAAPGQLPGPAAADAALPLDFRAISLALAAVALFEIAASGIWAYVERIGTEWNFAPQTIGTALSVGSLSGIPSALLVVAFSARWGRSRPIFLGVAGGILGLAVLLSNLHTVWIYTASILIFSAAWSFTVPYIQGVQAQLDPSGRVAVLGMFVVLLSIAAGPFVFGLLIGGEGYRAGIVFGCLLLCGCLAAVSGVARRQDLQSASLKNPA